MTRFIVSIFVAITLISNASRAAPPKSERLVCCGADQVFVVDAADPSRNLWSWKASDSPSIPEEFRPKFRSTDDCKPYKGDLMLITSSARGVALIHRETKRCLFLAEVPNAHSACLLPGNQIAVAASTSGDGVFLFSRNDDPKNVECPPAVPVLKIPLTGAHGTVWDVNSKRLWALGTDELLQIRQSDNAEATTEWSVTARHELPSSGGHDLSLVHGGPYLFVTTDTQVLRFNTTDGAFTVAEGFGSQKKIKSVDLHPVTRCIVFHQALADEWWSRTIRFNDAPPVTLVDQRLYKIRWDVPADRP